MAIYVYRCPECGRERERVNVPIASRDEPQECPECGAGMKRQFHVPVVRYMCLGFKAVDEAYDPNGF